MCAFLMRLVFNVTKLERHNYSLGCVQALQMHMWNYVCACLSSKFIGVHILLHVQAHIKSKTPKLCMRSYSYMCLPRQLVYWGAYYLTCYH